MEIPDALKRELRNENKEIDMFPEILEDWKFEWHDMPEFTQEDARPIKKLTVNFLTREDYLEFAKLVGTKIGKRTNSIWYPNQSRTKSGRYLYSGPKTDSKYPICIPSKGRADCQSTGKVLEKMGVTHRFFVEETEADEYRKHVGEQRVVSMPFHDLGQGSIPARNFIWEWAKSNGYKRHWTVDDNMKSFKRCNFNRRLSVQGGGFFQAMEDFVDRYENIVMAGPHNTGFCPDRTPNLKPYFLNSRIYSCILLDTSLPHRWRGRYNEDTDLSLRLLKDGYCTLLFNALLMDKGDTVRAGANPMKGGNTDNVYNSGDHRLAFVQSLVDQHPDCVKLIWRYGRYHHLVDYSSFRYNKPIKKKGIIPTPHPNNYDMELVHVKK